MLTSKQSRCKITPRRPQQVPWDVGQLYYTFPSLPAHTARGHHLAHYGSDRLEATSGVLMVGVLMVGVLMVRVSGLEH